MKKLIFNYTFDASAKTITFGDYAEIDLERVLLVTNVTNNVMLYSFADPTRGGTVQNNVLTLDYDTANMNDTDTLLIYYDDDNEKQKITLLDRPRTEKFLSYRFTSTTSGVIVGVQGKLLLGSVDINIAGASGSRVIIYDSYYTTSNPKYNIDGAIVGQYAKNTLLTQGCFLVITSSGAAPDVTVKLRPNR